MAGSIQVRGLTKSFGTFRAVDDVTFEAAEGTITALLGPSGSGKSTVLRMIAGLEQPDAGSVWVAGEELTEASVQDRRLGFVFQHYALFRHMTVRKNVAFGLSVRRVDKADTARASRRAARAGRPGPLRRQVSRSALRRPAPASGAGTGARAPPARCCCWTSRSAHWTPASGRSCDAWLDHLHRELGVTSLFVTHDQEEALELANEIVVMNHGRVEQVGPADAIYNQPATPFVAAFVGASNVLRGTVWERPRAFRPFHRGRRARDPRRRRGDRLHPPARHRDHRRGRLDVLPGARSNGAPTWGGCPSFTSGSRTDSHWWPSFPTRRS